MQATTSTVWQFPNYNNCIRQNQTFSCILLFYRKISMQKLGLRKGIKAGSECRDDFPQILIRTFFVQSQCYHLGTVDSSQYFFQITYFKPIEFAIFPEFQAKDDICLCRKNKDRNSYCLLYKPIIFMNYIFLPFISCLVDFPSSFLS